MRPSIEQTHPGKANRGSFVFFFERLFFVLLIFAGMASQVNAGEITVHKDKNGRCVYVNSDDRELQGAVERGGVAAGLRVIERRKYSLPGIDSYIEQIALENRLDPKLVDAVIEIESGWNPKARSQKGALGLMQLMPETAARFGVHDPIDPLENIAGGVRYLRILLDRFSQNLTYTLAAYNAGENVVAERGDVPSYPETRNYVGRVTALYAALQGESVPIPRIVNRTISPGLTIYSNVD